MSTALGPPRRPPAKRPVWLIVVLAVVGVLVLFAAGFAAALLIGGDTERPTVVAGGATAEPETDVSTEPEPCETTLVAPAEVLPRPDSVVVNVYNSTNRAGLASTVAQDLSLRGFRINKVENGYEVRWAPPFRGDEVVDYVLYRVDLPGGSAPVCEAELGMLLTAVVETLPDNSGFFVVARNEAGEGSPGRNSRGQDRPGPAAGSVCP